MLKEIVMADSSPGFPYLQLGRQNKEIIKTWSPTIVKLTIDRLMKLARMQIDTYHPRVDVLKAIDNNYMDPVRLFVKNEPHTTKKMNSESYRLIHSVSLVDQLVERMLYGVQNNLEINEWFDIPSKPGIGLSTDQDLNLIKKNIQEIENPASTDVSGWDISVQDWELMADATIRINLAVGTPGQIEIFSSLVKGRTTMLINSAYVLSDGTLYVPTIHFGIQKSGCYTTSSTNSRIRVLAAVILLSAKAMAMGDDCIESYIEDAIRKYYELGHNMKFYDKVTDGMVEFCSHLFDLNSDNIAYPTNPAKSLFRLICQTTGNVNYQTLSEFLFFVRHCPEFSQICDIINNDQRWKPLYQQWCIRTATKQSGNNVLAFPQHIFNMTRRTKKSNPKPREKGYPELIVDEVANMSKNAYQAIQNSVGLGNAKKLMKMGLLKNTNKPARKAERQKSAQVGVNSFAKIGKETFNTTSIKDGIRVRGHSLAYELTDAFGGTAAACRVLANIPLNPYYLNSWQLSRMAQGYQKFKFKNVRVRVVTQLPTSTAGLMFAAIYPSNETIPSSNGIALKRFLQSNPSFVEASAWEGVSTSMPSSHFLPYYDIEMQGLNVDTSVQGNIVIGITGSFADDQYLGDVVIDYDVELYNQTAPNIELIQNGDYIAKNLDGPSTYMIFTYTVAGNAEMQAAYNFWSKYPGLWRGTARLPILTTLGGAINVGETFYMTVDNQVSITTVKFFPSLIAITNDEPFPLLGSVPTATLVVMFKGFYLEANRTSKRDVVGKEAKTTEPVEEVVNTEVEIVGSPTEEWTETWGNCDPEEEIAYTRGKAVLIEAPTRRIAKALTPQTVSNLINKNLIQPHLTDQASESDPRARSLR